MKIKFKYNPRKLVPLPDNIKAGDKIVCINNRKIKSEYEMKYTNELEVGKTYTYSTNTGAYSEETIRCEEFQNTHLLSNFAVYDKGR